MELIELNASELNEICPGEAITLAGVLAILVIAIAAVVTYKLFMSGKGSAKLPGGYAFEWK